MAWPISLPAPLLSGYVTKSKQPLRRTPMEAGPDRVQRISSVTMYKVTITMILNTLAQRQDLITFYDGEANAGATFVTIPIDTGHGKYNHSVRFTSEPIPVPVGNGIYKVACTVETPEQKSS